MTNNNPKRFWLELSLLNGLSKMIHCIITSVIKQVCVKSFDRHYVHAVILFTLAYSQFV